MSHVFHMSSFNTIYGVFSHVKHMCLVHVFHMWNSTCDFSHVKFHLINSTCEKSNVYYYIGKSVCDLSSLQVYMSLSRLWETSRLKFLLWLFSGEFSHVKLPHWIIPWDNSHASCRMLIFHMGWVHLWLHLLCYFICHYSREIARAKFYIFGIARLFSYEVMREVKCEIFYVISHVKFHIWEITWYLTCEISHVKFPMLNFTCEKSHAKFHMSNFLCGKSHVEFHMWKEAHVKRMGFEFHRWFQNCTCKSREIFCKGSAHETGATHTELVAYLYDFMREIPWSATHAVTNGTDSCFPFFLMTHLIFFGQTGG